VVQTAEEQGDGVGKGRNWKSFGEVLGGLGSVGRVQLLIQESKV
jgi:hypothetical protein